jgi:DNA-binding transcriptional LysR family regulator
MVASPGALGEMEAFACAVELGSFTAAARKLGLTSSAVSKQIARLEERLGARLLARTTRRLALTEPGRAYHERCTRILADIEELDRSVADGDGAPRGLVRVSAPNVLGRLRVAPALLAFQKKYPEVRVELELSDRLAEVAAGAIDVAVRVTAIPTPGSLTARKLAEETRVLCASPRYLKRRGTPRAPGDLERHDGLTLLAEGPARWELHGADGRHVVRIPSTFRCNDSLLLRDAALAGLGVVNLPLYMVERELEAGDLIRALPAYVGAPRSVYALYAHGPHAPVRVRALVEELARAFARRRAGGS